MFHQVSWISFFLFLLILTSVYYFTMLILYYRQDIKTLLKAKSNSSPFQPAELISLPDLPKESPVAGQADISAKVSKLIPELKKIAGIAFSERYPKEELIMALQILLKGYPDVKASKLQPDINNHIALLCKETCSLSLTEEELCMLWQG